MGLESTLLSTGRTYNVSEVAMGAIVDQLHGTDKHELSLTATAQFLFQYTWAGNRCS
jgi:hypothetical protein